MTIAAPTTRRTPAQRRLSMLQDSALICVSVIFFFMQTRRAIDEHSLVNIGFALEQAILIGAFLTRRRAQVTSRRPFEWVVAIGGWLPLLGQPADGDVLGRGIGAAIQIAGLGLVVLGMCYLGRSFGVVAANRGLKINGPYRFVRHPVYSAHAITFTGFLVANPSAWNAGLFVATCVMQVLRIRAEERVLTESAEYAQYRQRVRWRVLPGLY